MTFVPFDWQLADVQTLRTNNYNGLLNIEPGGTKTAISTLAAKDSGANVTLIVAPQQTHRSAWKKHTELILEQELRVIGNVLKAHKQAYTDFKLGYPGVYAVTPQLMTRADIDEWSGDLLIVDEVHQLSKPGSNGQKKLGGYYSNDRTLRSQFDSALALSGTPAMQNFERMWSNMRLCFPQWNKPGQVAYDNYYLWLDERMTYEDVVTGFDGWVPMYPGEKLPEGERPWRNPDTGVLMKRKMKTAKKWLSESEPGRLLSEAPCVIQHFRRAVCCEYHPVREEAPTGGFLTVLEPQILDHVVELVPAQRKAIRELEEHYMTWLADRPLVTELTLTQRQRIRQTCLAVPSIRDIYTDDEVVEEVYFEENAESPFLDEAINIIEHLPKDEPVVLFMESQKYAGDVVTKRLNAAGITAAEYSGKTKAERDAYLKDFGTKYQALVVTLAAGGTGLDELQHVSNTEIWLEYPVSLTNQTQAEARLDRMGTRHQVQRYRVIDSDGYATGQISTNLARQLELNKSLRRTV